MHEQHGHRYADDVRAPQNHGSLPGDLHPVPIEEFDTPLGFDTGKEGTTSGQAETRSEVSERGVVRRTAGLDWLAGLLRHLDTTVCEKRSDEVW